MAVTCGYCGAVAQVFTIMDGDTEVGEAVLCDDCGRWTWE